MWHICCQISIHRREAAKIAMRKPPAPATAAGGLLLKPRSPNAAFVGTPSSASSSSSPTCASSSSSEEQPQAMEMSHVKVNVDEDAESGITPQLVTSAGWVSTAGLRSMS